MAVTPRSYRRIALLHGVLCHSCFVIGVLAMIGALYFGMSRSLGRVPGLWGAVADGALILQFPLLHSLLLSRPGQTLLRRLAPAALGARLNTTSYATIASLQVFALFALWTPSGIVWWSAMGASRWLLSGAYALSWLLLLKAMLDAGIGLQIGALGWWAVLRGRNPVFPPMPRGGLFRLVRQPIYLAFACTLWTVPCWTPDQLALALCLTLYCLLGPLLKERRFRRRFGAEFEAYARRVPYWLPGLRL